MKKISKILKPKTTEEIIKSFCEKYDVDFPINEDTLGEALSFAINVAKDNKIIAVREQNFEKGAMYRDEERSLMEHQEYFERGGVNEWIDFMSLEF